MHRTPFRILIIGALILTASSLVRLPAEATHFGAIQRTPAQVATFSNSTLINIPNSPSVVAPYPSNITVSGLLGSITDVDVSLVTVSHSRPDDLDILLVGPGGQNAILMSDSCGNVTPGGASFTFSDQAASALENTDGTGTNCTTTGTYQPHNYVGGAPEPDIFGAPAPSGPYGTALSVFNGIGANGTWSLYVVDDMTGGSTGSINGGWSLTITTDSTAPTITSSPPSDGVVGSAYSHTYTATGSAPITFSLDPGGAFPPGLNLVGAVLGGTPTAAGTFTGVVRASNGVTPDATQPFSITITTASVAPIITSAPPPDGSVGSVYSHTYTASGSAPITFTLDSGAFPPGLNLVGAVLSGTPTTAGTYTGVVKASNGIAPDATQPFSITVSTAGTRPPASASTAYVPTAADHARAQAPLCSLMGGGTNVIVRAEVPSGAVTDGSVFCRVIAQNGVYVNGNNPSEIGSQDVITQGVVQAVDVFGLLHSGSSQPVFNSPVKICLEGSGAFLYLNALAAPRTVSTLPVTLEGGYTCALISDAGTAVLVQGDPPAVSPVPASSGEASSPLNGCMVTTSYMLNLRAGPSRDSDVIRVVPYNVTLTATQRLGDWFNVDYLGTSGWLNAGYLTPRGACG